MKGDTKAGDDVLHRARHEDLIGLGKCLYPLGDVDSDTCQIVVSKLDLSGMDASSNPKTEAMHPLADGIRALDRPGRSVDGGKESITDGLDLSSTNAIKLPEDKCVVRVEKLVPS